MGAAPVCLKVSYSVSLSVTNGAKITIKNVITGGAIVYISHITG